MILGLKSLLQSVAESGEGGKQAARDPVGSSTGRNALLEAVLLGHGHVTCLRLTHGGMWAAGLFLGQNGAGNRVSVTPAG